MKRRVIGLGLMTLALWTSIARAEDRIVPQKVSEERAEKLKATQEELVSSLRSVNRPSALQDEVRQPLTLEDIEKKPQKKKL